jgi:hypothetical protein
MPKVSIQLPPFDTDDKIEVTVVVNGALKKYDFRMELFAWEAHARPGEERAECLKRIVDNYDKDWSLVQIGEVSKKEISILFRRQSL